MLVQIEPIVKEKWHGHSGAKDFSRDTNFTPLCDTRTMRYAVELSEEEIKEYSKRTGKNLNLDFYPGEDHPFWDSKLALVTLKRTAVILDTELTLDFLRYRICKASTQVANSLEDYQNGLYPKATHYIYSEEEEVAVKATKVTIKNNALKASFAATRNEKNMVAFLIGGIYAKDLSDDFLDVKMDELITDKPEEVLAKFEHLKQDKEYVAVQNLVKEAIYFNVLLSKKGGYYYFETLVGHDTEEVTSFFKDDKNQALKIQIINNLKGKK
jgi:hypothetical protein